MDSADRIIGVDDVLAMLLALAAKPEELEILLLSVTYGNVEAQRYIYISMCCRFCSQH
jgi:inosine-uridine nucleoside N-ribohydrolase